MFDECSHAVVASDRVSQIGQMQREAVWLHNVRRVNITDPKKWDKHNKTSF